MAYAPSIAEPKTALPLHPISPKIASFLVKVCSAAANGIKAVEVEVDSGWGDIR